MITYRISDEVLKRVNHGDGLKIANQYGQCKHAICKAFKDKRARLKIYNTINDYYKNN